MKQMNLIMIFACGIFCHKAFAQLTADLYLSNGYKALYTAPAGWTKGTSYVNEFCFNEPGNNFSICISTKSRNGISAEAILDKTISDLSYVRCDNKSNIQPTFEFVWKECEVKVGPRTEWRIWGVITYKEAGNAIFINVSYQTPTASMLSTLQKSLEQMKFYDP